ncbi:MAG TPA: ABC transporter ATP-binding protein [Firmicutes bacterium]|nr:ABC transporter ATP-binding protein [Bacillota bacterium]
MKKYLKILWDITAGHRGTYLFSFILQFFIVIVMLLSTFMTKILVDTIMLVPPSGPIDAFLTDLFGGQAFLSENLWVFSVIILGLGFSRALMFFFRMYLRGVVETNIGREMQLKLFYHIERLPYPALKKAKSGDYIQTCTRDEETVRSFITRQVFGVSYALFIVTISFTLLMTLSPKIALVTIAILPIMFVYSYFLIRRVRKLYRETEDSDGLVSAKIEETLAGIRLVKAYNNEKYEIDDFDKHLQDYRNKFIRWRKLSSFFFASSDIFVFGQIVLTTLFGLYLALIGDITIGTLIVAFEFVSMIVWPVRDVAMTLSNLARAVAAMDRINVILQQPLEDIESGLRPEIKGAIEFDDMSFHYDDGDETILNHITLSIKAGETIAIMGKTGSGKSTLSHLLTRLYDYTSGSIKIDGVELKDIAKQHIRHEIATVLQEPFLFSKTIINNLKIANRKATIEEIHRAAQIADIHQNILSFKDGYETKVGEKGVTLSGGQKQRLAIARTIVNKAPILVFDDSLSAVDTETDIHIRSALKSRQADTTTLIITHRVATAKDADRIVVLEDGKISQIGTHQQLLNEPGLYRRVHDIQTRMV